MGLEQCQHLEPPFSIFVARLGNFGQPLHLFLHRFQVRNLQFQVEGLNVPDRIHRAIDVGQLLIVEASDHLDQGIGIADVREEFVAHPFALTGAFGESGNIHNLHGGRDHLLRGLEVFQVVEPGIGYIHHAHVGLVGSEGKTGCFHLGVGHTIEQSGFAHVRYPDNPTFQCHAI